MAKTLKINGTDYTSFLTPTGYTVSFIKRRGPNSGDMLDGSYTDDVRAIKAVVTCYCMPLDEQNIGHLLREVKQTYVTVYYYDPDGGYRTMEAIPSEPTQKYRGYGADGKEYWTGTVIVFTER